MSTECVIISKNINGEWKEVEHTATFHYGDEFTISYQSSEGYSIIESYIKSGAEETGKYDGENPIYRVTGDIEVIYSERLNSYIVGEIPSQVIVTANGKLVQSGQEINYGTEITVTVNITEGHHMTNFEVGGAEQLTDNTYKIVNILNITYEEEINTYTVTFYDYDNTELDKITVSWGEEAFTSTPTREDDETYIYTFSHWANGEGEVADLTSIKQDTVVYAQYSTTYIEYGVTTKIAHSQYIMKPSKKR